MSQKSWTMRARSVPIINGIFGNAKNIRNKIERIENLKMGWDCARVWRIIEEVAGDLKTLTVTKSPVINAKHLVWTDKFIIIIIVVVIYFYK